MKFIKTIPLVGVFLAVVPIATYKHFTCTKCVATTTIEETNDHFKYISDRTLSIGILGLDDSLDLSKWQSYSFGTAWFYEYLGGNKYEMITNYHVYYGMKYCMSSNEAGDLHSGLAFLSGKDYDDTSEYSYSDYCLADVDFDIAGLDMIDKFMGATSVHTDYGYDVDFELYMDMVGITIDFSDLLANKYESAHVQPLIDKIDYLKDLYPNKGDKMLDVADSVTKDETVYIAGYPWTDSTVDMKSSTVEYTTYESKTDVYQPDKITPISSEDYYTEQNEWYLPGEDKFVLDSGASGSPVIDEDNKLCGIFWGGRKDTDDTTHESKYYSSFATFSIPGEDKTFLDVIDSKLI